MTKQKLHLEFRNVLVLHCIFLFLGGVQYSRWLNVVPFSIVEIQTKQGIACTNFQTLLVDNG